MRLHLRAAAASLALLAFAGPAQAQSRASNVLSLDQYLDWRDVQAPQLSPDGAQIIYTRRWVDKMNDRWETNVWLMNASPLKTGMVVMMLACTLWQVRPNHRRGTSSGFHCSSNFASMSA